MEGAGVVEDVVLTDARGIPAELADRVLDEQRPASPPRDSDPALAASAEPSAAREQAHQPQPRSFKPGEDHPA